MTEHRPLLLVTGATGFLGSEIVRQACQAGIHLRATGRRAMHLPGVEYSAADITRPDSLKPLMQGVECVIHAAGLAHVSQHSEESGQQFSQVNLQGAANLAQAAVTTGASHLVLVSSVAAYGPHGDSLCDESTPCRPQGPYAQSKLLAEKAVRKVVEGAATRLTVLRMATLYGEEDPGNVRRLIHALDRGRFFWIGKGANRKSLVHREDAARACLVAANGSQRLGSLYNVAGPSSSIREIVGCICSALGRPLPRWHVPAGWASGLSRVAAASGWRRLGRLHLAVQKWLRDDAYDGSRLQSELGFQFQVCLAEGLRREVDWYQKLQEGRRGG